MASTADHATDAKADAAAEKAYAAASAKPADAPKAVDAAKPAPTKIDAAVAEVKAAPVASKARAKKSAPAKAAASRKAKPAVRKVRAAKALVRKTAAARPAPTNTVSPVSKLKDKIMATTTKTTDFTKTAKDAAADMQTRAKAAYDKLQAYAGEMTEFTKGNVDAIVESGKIIGAGVQDLARVEVEAAKGAFETITADLKAMAAVKSPTELFKLQGEIARRNFDAVVARASKNAEVSMKLANEAFAPISTRMSIAAEKVSKAA